MQPTFQRRIRRGRMTGAMLLFFAANAWPQGATSAPPTPPRIRFDALSRQGPLFNYSAEDEANRRIATRENPLFGLLTVRHRGARVVDVTWNGPSLTSDAALRTYLEDIHLFSFDARKKQDNEAGMNAMSRPIALIGTFIQRTEGRSKVRYLRVENFYDYLRGTLEVDEDEKGRPVYRISNRLNQTTVDIHSGKNAKAFKEFVKRRKHGDHVLVLGRYEHPNPRKKNADALRFVFADEYEADYQEGTSNVADVAGEKRVEEFQKKMRELNSRPPRSR